MTRQTVYRYCSTTFNPWYSTPASIRATKTTCVAT